jgi:hypothetical protein
VSSLGFLGSFVYDKGESATRRIDDYLKAKIPVMLDSGAFSVLNSGAHIDIDDHIKWVKYWKNRNKTSTLLLNISLDVIGNQEATIKNYKYQISKGAIVVPTIHYPTNPKEIDSLLDTPSGWVSLGGLVRFFSKSHLDNVTSWSAAILSRAHKKNIKVHALGAIVPEIHWALPLDSCDSTYWLSGSRFGQHSLFDPTIRHWRKIKTKSKSSYKYGSLLRDIYGTSPEEIDADTRGESGRKLAERLAIHSHDIFADTFRKRHDSDLIIYLAGGHPDIVSHNRKKGQ